MKKLFKVFSTIIVFYVIVKIADVIKSLVVAAILGVSFEADIYLGVLNIPDLLLILVGFDSIKGVLNSEFSSLKANEKLNELWSSFIKLFYFFTVLGAIFLLLFILFRNTIVEVLLPGFTGVKKDLAVNIFLIITPVFFLKIIFSLSQAVSNAFQKYYIPIIVPIAVNITILGSLLFPAFNNSIIYNLAYGVTIGNVIVILIMLFYNIKLGAKFNLKDFKPDKVTLKVLKSISLMVIMVIINQLFFTSRNFFASYMADGSVSALSYATMVSNIFSVFIFTVFFNVLLSETSTLFASNKNEEAKNLFFNVTYSIFYFIIPIVIVLVICKINILQLIFLRGNFSKDKIDLLFNPYLWETLSLIPFVVFICFVSLYLAAKEYKLLTKIGVPIFIVGIFLNYFLSKNLGLYGLSLSYFIISTLYAVFLFTFSRNFMGEVHTYVFKLLKMVFAGIVLFVTLVFVKFILKGELNDSILTSVVFISVVFAITFSSYYFITHFLKVNYFKRIMTIFFELKVKS